MREHFWLKQNLTDVLSIHSSSADDRVVAARAACVGFMGT